MSVLGLGGGLWWGLGWGRGGCGERLRVISMSSEFDHGGSGDLHTEVGDQSLHEFEDINIEYVI